MQQDGQPPMTHEQREQAAAPRYLLMPVDEFLDAMPKPWPGLNDPMCHGQLTFAEVASHVMRHFGLNDRILLNVIFCPRTMSKFGKWIHANFPTNRTFHAGPFTEAFQTDDWELPDNPGQRWEVQRKIRDWVESAFDGACKEYPCWENREQKWRHARERFVERMERKFGDAEPLVKSAARAV